MGKFLTVWLSLTLSGCAAVSESALPPGQPLRVAEGRALGLGEALPAFELPDLEGLPTRSASWTGRPLVLAFLYAHGSGAAESARAVRAQAATLKSLDEQYRGRGVQLVVVDESSAAGDWNAETAANYRADTFPDVPFLIDDGRLAERLGVRSVPTTFLVDAAGTLAGRWDQVALTHQLALVLEPLLDGQDDWSTPAESPFPGLPPARRLAEGLWLVDGGQPWSSDKPYPLRVLAFTGAGSASVTIRVVSDGKPALLLDGPLSQVSREDAALWGAGGRKAFLRDFAAELPPGRYRIEAVLRDGEADVAGQGAVLVR